MKCFLAVFLIFSSAAMLCPENSGSAILSFKFFPQDAVLRIDGRDGREVLPGGNKAGVRTFRIARGLRVLTLSAPGYHDKTVRVDVSGDLYLEDKLERADSLLVLAGETPTGTMPKSVVFTRDGSRLVVPLLAERGVDVIPMDGLVPRDRVELTPPGSSRRGYVEPALVEGRNEIWVSQMDTGQVHILGGETLEYRETVDVRGRWSKVIAVSPDEKLAFVSNWLSKDVSVIDVVTRRVVKVIPVSGVPRGMAATSDGNFLYVCIFDTGNIDIIALDILEVKETLRFGPGAKRHIVLDDAEGKGYVSDMATGRVSSFSLADGKILKSLWVGSNLNTLVMGPDGRHLFVSSRGRNNPETYLKKGPDFGRIIVIDAAAMKIVDWVWGRNQPTGLAVSPDGRHIAFTDFLDDNLEVYDISGLYEKTASAADR